MRCDGYSRDRVGTAAKARYVGHLTLVQIRHLFRAFCSSPCSRTRNDECCDRRQMVLAVTRAGLDEGRRLLRG